MDLVSATVTMATEATAMLKRQGYPHTVISPDVCKLLNEQTTTTTEAATRFQRGLEECGYSSFKDLLGHKDGYVLALHGTNAGNASSILKYGFDPKLRRVQCLGPGEYFDLEGSFADRYCEGMGMLACIVVRKSRRKKSIGAWYSLHYDGKIVVAKNPLDGRFTYALPVVVASKLPWE